MEMGVVPMLYVPCLRYPTCCIQIVNCVNADEAVNHKSSQAGTFFGIFLFSEHISHDVLRK